MKNLQVRLSDEVHETLQEIARERQTSLADIVRESLEVYGMGVMYAKEGKHLVWEDPISGRRAELLIPGLTMMRRFKKNEPQQGTGPDVKSTAI